MQNAVQTNTQTETVGKEQSTQQQPTVYEIVHYEADTFIQQMAYMLIRPPRFAYNRFLLNPVTVKQKFFLQNHQLPQFQLSIYMPINKNIKYVILYLHGNSSSRLEALLYLNQLPQRVAIASFDFLGCGNRVSAKKQINKRQYLTLGKRQSQQVDVAAKYLKSLGYRVVGWGRSMGSVSLLLSNQIQIMVVDSPFSSLVQLCQESYKKLVPCYMKCIAPLFYSFIFEKVKTKVFELSGLDLDEMEIGQKINRNYENRQICFMHGQNDEIFDYHHSQSLYNKFQGRKQYILFEGSHNTNRSQQVIDACIQFIEESFETIELREAQKRSKLVFVREKNEKKISLRKSEILNSLKKNKKKIHLPSLSLKQRLKKKIKNGDVETREEIEQRDIDKIDMLKINFEQLASVHKLPANESQTSNIVSSKTQGLPQDQQNNHDKLNSDQGNNQRIDVNIK